MKVGSQEDVSHKASFRKVSQSVALNAVSNLKITRG